MDMIDPQAKAAMTKARQRFDKRQPIVAHREKIAELLRPLRADDLYPVEGSPRGEASMDSTGMVALDQAGAGIYSMLTGSDTMFAPLSFVEDWRNDDDEARAWLEAENHALFMTLDPAFDNFHSDVPEIILDSIAFGDGCYFDTPKIGTDRFISKAIPWREAVYEVGEFGQVTHFDRWYQEPLWNIAEMFGKENLSDTLQQLLTDKPNEPHKMVHTTFPNQGVEGVSAKHEVASLYMLEKGDLLQRGGYREMPYHVARWGVGSGQTYGVGRATMAMPDVAMLDEMKRSTLIAAQKAAEPAFAVSDELAELLDTSPNAQNIGALDEAGNLLVKPIQTGANPQITLELIERTQSQIRDTLYFAILSTIGAPSASTVETLENIERRDQTLGPNISRLIAEFIAPFILARFRARVRTGRVSPPPPSAQGAALRVRVVSPLARAHKAREASATMEWAGAVKALAELDPEAALELHGPRSARIIAEGLSVPEGARRSKSEREAALQKESEAAELAGGLGAAEQGARAMESVARAEQASANAAAQTPPQPSQAAPAA